MRECTDQKNSEYGHFSGSVIQSSSNLTGASYESCCQKLVDVVFHERELQRFTKVSRSCNDSSDKCNELVPSHKI